MSKVRIHRTLPPVEEVFRDFQGFTNNRSKQFELEEILRIAAARLKKPQAQPFYAMRVIVGFFKLPLRSVALAYQTLEQEGILNRLRGTVTMLEGEQIAPRKPVRAVVGIPVWLHDVVVSPYARGLYLKLEESLRKKGFVADLIFFRAMEVSSPDFVQRLLDHNLDILIWHTMTAPPSAQMLLSLKEGGVRLIVIQSAEQLTSLPVSTYLLDWRSAYADLAKIWAESGIRDAVIPAPINSYGKTILAGLCNSLSANQIQSHVVEEEADKLLDQVSQLSKTRPTGLAFIDIFGAERICNESPHIVEAILKQARIAFCRGAIRTPYFNHHTQCADLVLCEAAEIAEKITYDLSRTPVLPEKLIHTFKAELDSQRPLFTTFEEL